MNIDLNLIKIFNEVARFENITKASEKLFISQPAVSQSIKKLEQELGGTLFHRSNKGLKLTEEGKKFYEYSKKAVELILKGEDDFNNFKSLTKGTIKIGVSTTLTKLVLLEPIMNFHKDYPKIRIEIVNGLTPTIISELKKNNLDFVIFNDANVDEELNTFKIKEASNCFIYNEDFFNFASNITLKELEKYPLIIQNKESYTRMIFDELVSKNKLNINPYMEVVSQELVYIFALCGLGIGFTIEEFVDYEKNPKIKKVSLRDPIEKFSIKLAQSSFYTPTFASKKFIEFILKK